MMATVFFLAFMAILIKFSTLDKAWLWFAVLVGLLAQWGYELSMFQFIAALVGFKVLKDVCNW